MFDAKVCGVNEVCLFLRSNNLETGLVSEDEIDGFVQRLKLDLDIAAATAKTLMKKERAKPLLARNL